MKPIFVWTFFVLIAQASAVDRESVKLKKVRFWGILRNRIFRSQNSDFRLSFTKMVVLQNANSVIPQRKDKQERRISLVGSDVCRSPTHNSAQELLSSI